MKNRLFSFIGKNRVKLVKIASVLLLVVVIVWLTFQFAPFIASLKDEASRRQYEAEIRQKGVAGWFTMLGVQVLQVVVALIPGEPVELLSGILYGTLGGLFTCLAGVLIGSMLIFYAVRWLGHSLATAFVESDKLKRLSFLKNTKKLEFITFILFFIPGTPKDVLTYFAGLTPIRPVRFFVISTLARIPSIVTSTYAGEVFRRDGNFWTFAIIYAIVLALAGAGLLVNRLVMKKLNERHKKEELPQGARREEPPRPSDAQKQ